MILGKNFSNLKVILVEPNGPLNVGSVARLCSNFEVDELRIVSPRCDIFSLDAKKMALKGQKFIDVVNKELIKIMGNENSPLNENENSPTVILMAGLQGAGKTTATGKLGLYLKEKEKKVLLVAADIYRPAAVEQLKTIGNQYDLEVFSAKEKNSKPEEIAKDALN